MNNKNIHKITSLIKEIIEIIQLPSTNTDFSEWDTPLDAVNHFNRILKELESDGGKTTAIAKLKIIFAPTGSLQDLAISSGWGNEYLDLAEKFDHLIED
jgi:hypothetical protein